jgi:hypothetical protein
MAELQVEDGRFQVSGFEASASSSTLALSIADV